MGLAVDIRALFWRLELCFFQRQCDGNRKPDHHFDFGNNVESVHSTGAERYLHFDRHSIEDRRAAPRRHRRISGDGIFTGPSVSLNANAQAALTTTTLPTGNLTISVVYSGDAAYTGSSGNVSETVTPAPDFSVVANPASITIAKPGQSGNTMLMLTAMNGLTGTFTLVPQCTALPSESSCGVSPTSVTFSSTVTTATVMLTVSTAAPSNVVPNKRVHPTGPGMGTALALTLLALLSVLFFLSKRRRFEVALSLIAFAALLMITSCGGGGGSVVHDPGTPVDMDNNATVSFTLGSASHAVAVSINVQ